MKVLQLFIALIFCFPLVAQEEVYVDFVDGDWSEVVAQATKENKYIMVDAYTDWCYWCKVMDKNTFRDADVVAFLDENFVSTKINCEKGTGTDFNMKFRIAGFPTLMFFNPAGQVVGRQVGYESDNAKFVEILESMMDVKDRQPYAYDGNEWYPGFPDFYKKSFKRDDTQAVRINEDEATEFLDDQKDLFGEVAFSVMSRSPLSEKYVDHYVDNYEKYLDMYGQDEAESVLTRAAFGKAREATEAKDWDMLMVALDILEPLDDEVEAQYAISFKGRYYQTIKDWVRYADVYQEAYTSQDIEDITGLLNSASWTLYENCDYQGPLEMALVWMEDVVDEDPQYAYLDTYAALLAKLGMNDQATEAAERAINKAKETGEDYSGTTKILEQTQLPPEKKGANTAPVPNNPPHTDAEIKDNASKSRKDKSGG